MNISENGMLNKNLLKYLWRLASMQKEFLIYSLVSHVYDSLGKCLLLLEQYECIL